MSENTIREKTQEIRNETQKYANTRGRVAEVLDDINSTKANKDATELTEDDKQSWKTALGVGELPTNIATIDQSEQQGNTYTKGQIEEKLGNKLTTPDPDYGVNGDLDYLLGFDPRSREAGLFTLDRFAKNLEDQDLRLPQGTVRTLDITDAKLQLKGLQNRKQDASFRQKIKVNDRGELGLSDDIEAVINLPENINYSTGTPTFNLNITKIEQTITAPNNPEFSTQIQEVMRNLFDYELTPYTAEDYGIVGHDRLRLQENGYLNEIPHRHYTNKTFDPNTDFVVKIENLSGGCGFGTSIVREASPNSLEYWRGGDCSTSYNIGFFIKKENILFFVGYMGNGNWQTAIWNIPLELGWIKFVISATKVSYKIF